MKKRAKLTGKILLMILYASLKAANYYSNEGDIEIEWNIFCLGWIYH